MVDKDLWAIRLFTFTLFICVVTMLVAIFGASWFANQQFERAKDTTLDETPGVVDSNLYNQGYRQGWLDAIARLSAWYYAPVNSTTNLLNY